MLKKDYFPNFGMIRLDIPSRTSKNSLEIAINTKKLQVSLKLFKVGSSCGKSNLLEDYEAIMNAKDLFE